MARKKKTEGDVIMDSPVIADCGCKCECNITNEPVSESDETFDMAEHTCISFCCKKMMKLMLGGQSQACGISQETGAIQIGNIDASFCPYCGQSIIVGDAPADPDYVPTEAVVEE